jgi:hypothetical protein
MKEQKVKLFGCRYKAVLLHEEYRQGFWLPQLVRGRNENSKEPVIIVLTEGFNRDLGLFNTGRAGSLTSLSDEPI